MTDSTQTWPRNEILLQNKRVWSGCRWKSVNLHRACHVANWNAHSADQRVKYSIWFTAREIVINVAFTLNKTWRFAAPGRFLIASATSNKSHHRPDNARNQSNRQLNYRQSNCKREVRSAISKYAVDGDIVDTTNLLLENLMIVNNCDPDLGLCIMMRSTQTDFWSWSQQPIIVAVVSTQDHFQNSNGLQQIAAPMGTSFTFFRSTLVEAPKFD